MFGVELLWWVGCLCSCWHNQKPGSLVHKWVTRFSESENMSKESLSCQAKNFHCLLFCFSESENMSKESHPVRPKTFNVSYFASQKVKIWAKKVFPVRPKTFIGLLFCFSKSENMREESLFCLSTFCFQLDDNYGWIDERKEITTLYKDWIQVEPFQHFPGYPLWSVDLPTKKEILWQQQTFWEEFSLGHPPWNSCHMLFRTLLFFQLLFPQPLWLTSTALSQASFQVVPSGSNGEWPGVGCHL